MSYVVENYARCSCGAYTFYLYNPMTGEKKNVSYEGTIKSFLQKPEIITQYLSSRKKLNNFCNCNYCVNHWGLDLCGCGSGEKLGECECGGQIPAQSLENESYCCGGIKAMARAFFGG